jgi:hypothetical protein
MKMELTEGPSPIVPVVPDEPYTIYIEGLQHNWSFKEGVTSSSVLTFTRGYIEGDRLKDLKTARSEWSDMGVTPAPGISTPDPTESDESTLEGILG